MGGGVLTRRSCRTQRVEVGAPRNQEQMTFKAVQYIVECYPINLSSHTFNRHPILYQLFKPSIPTFDREHWQYIYVQQIYLLGSS